MTNFRKLSALLAVSAVLAAGPAAAYGVSPSAPESEQSASTVQVRDMAQPNGQNAPRSGVNPTAPRSEQNATTVPASEALRTGTPAPRIGVSPSAPEQVFNATTVSPNAVN